MILLYFLFGQTNLYNSDLHCSNNISFGLCDNEHIHHGYDNYIALSVNSVLYRYIEFGYINLFPMSLGASEKAKKKKKE